MKNSHDSSPTRRENDTLNRGTEQSQEHQRPQHENFLYNPPKNQQDRDISSSPNSTASFARSKITNFTKYWANNPPETERGRKLSGVEQPLYHKKQRIMNQFSPYDLQETFEQQSLDPKALSQRSHEFATRYTAHTQLSREQLQQFQKDYSTHLQNLDSALKYDQSLQETINSYDQQIKTLENRTNTSISSNINSMDRQDIEDSIKTLKASKQDLIKELSPKSQIEQLQKDQQQAIIHLQEINTRQQEVERIEQIFQPLARPTNENLALQYPYDSGLPITSSSTDSTFSNFTNLLEDAEISNDRLLNELTKVNELFTAMNTPLSNTTENRSHSNLYGEANSAEQGSSRNNLPGEIFTESSNQTIAAADNIKLTPRENTRNEDNTTASFSADDFRLKNIIGIIDAKNVLGMFATNNDKRKKNKLGQETAENLADTAKNDFDALAILIGQHQWDAAAAHWESMRTTKATTFQENSHSNTYQKALENIALVSPTSPDNTIASFSADDFRLKNIKGIRDAKRLITMFAKNNGKRKKNKLGQEIAENLADTATNDFDTLAILIGQRQWDTAATHWESMRTTKAITFRENSHSNTYQTALENIALVSPTSPDNTIASFSADDFRLKNIKGIKDAKYLFITFVKSNKKKERNKLGQEIAEKLAKTAINDFDTLVTFIEQRQWDAAATHWESMRTTKATTFQENTLLKTYQTALGHITLSERTNPD